MGQSGLVAHTIQASSVDRRPVGRPDQLDDQLPEGVHHARVELAAGTPPKLDNSLGNGELGRIGRGEVMAVKASQTAMTRAPRGICSLASSLG
jgi:hypothetical protein